MTLSIAIIGTSHVAALALAWREIGDQFPDVDVEFFAAPGWNFRRLQIDEKKELGVLDVAQFEPEEVRLLENSFGKSKISLRNFDAVLYVGRDVYEADLVSLTSQFSVQSRREMIEKSELTYDAYAAFSRALIKKALLPTEWQNWDAPKLFVVPAPRFGENCKRAEGEIYKDWAELMEQFSAGYPFKSLLDEYLCAVSKRYSQAGITLVLTPEELLGESGLTRSEYTQNSRQLTNVQYSDQDYKHMNSDYGKVVLSHAIDKIASAIGSEIC